MPQIIDIVQQNGIQWTNDVRANMGAAGINATLKTANSLRIEVRQEGTKIKMTAFGRPFFNTIRTGRQPTKANAPTGSPTLVEMIREWMLAKGVVGNEYAIANKIHKEGTNLYRQGGRTDIVEPATDDLINSTAQDLLDAKADDLILKIREMKW